MGWARENAPDEPTQKMTDTLVAVLAGVTVKIFCRHAPLGSPDVVSRAFDVCLATTEPLPSNSCTMSEHELPKASLMRLAHALMV